MPWGMTSLKNRGVDPADRFRPALEVRRDEPGFIRMIFLKLSDGLDERSAGVLLAVPSRRGDLGEELLHSLFVAREQLAIQMARIPVDQHAAEVEDRGRELALRARVDH